MITIYTSKSIKHKVQSIILSYGTNNVYEICEQLNIIITKNNLGRAEGLLQHHKEENRYIIHVNENLKHQTFITAHELGHYFLHKNLNAFKISNCSALLKDKLEDQANIFASEMLLPDKLLKEHLFEIQKFTIHQLASFFNIPTHAIQHKYSQMKLLSRNRMESGINHVCEITI
ncbi:ImmA/IrrE family metallo-endopeptidase [Bacillus atrophaeus]|uniref:ImmA/IrrE family metallo-endopeptidase n=1 Tax=Bacillus atrophaeus TaxID=1452 RepID=UPI002DBDC885|nr:ImmA/IrrE family metallo-endopeptidase [Bacillus atrophaeus]MEC1900705.1 ImmA/IrrE family metallo-endopeptidase [Bacillus atrophaeus]MEC2396540.1 ImmA/IrrE family metallo-endopeptidase [Bacillus atrophaeus]MED4436195.1 ImmA/IrrE family metallo-endopeptidase [Bacillus atrophaeus]MED4563801.1 ImmA/IrrE family metallo-endopeptidase [Bacillus atrophaeus]MED4575158.1 ImmA/IrrE family metallo-endopeptidase [Bacillus atrophaeus]